MRWALVKLSLAVTTMVVLAFAIPLGIMVRELARDRAFSDAERQAAALGPALAITTDRDSLERAVASTRAGIDGAIAVHLPERAVVGNERAAAGDVDAASARGRAATVKVPGGYALLQPVAVESGDVAVVEVYVPNEAVTRGVATAMLILAGVGVALIIGSVAVADRLGTRMVVPARNLAAAARALGESDLSVRVPETGPVELRSAAAAFNSMADHVVQLLAAERELAADLSHRLRTPLTVLRLNADSLGRGPAGDQTRHAVSQLEREVDQIIRTARRQTPGPGTVGCDAAEVIRERMAFWSALAEDQDRESALSGTDRPALVPVARPDLVAAIDAMIGNVFRHTPEGTSFAVDVHPGADAVIVLVSDAGPGINDPAAALRRGQGQGGAGSTGLGLDIVRKLAESTGGDVAIGQSVLGGAEVRVRLNTGRRLAGGGSRRRSHRLRRGRPKV